MIEVIDIGQTFERRPILLAKISLKNNLPGITKRAIFIEAGKTITTSVQVKQLYGLALTVKQQ